ncbi:MAG: sulfotransferase domain-containing protein [Steroidobacteraceae bacterium]
MTLPTFLYIGPDKAGSTWIFQLLQEHPGIFVAPSKDIYFFDRYFDRGLEWYESHFELASSRQAVGEISHDYLYSESACIRIRRLLPEVRLIVNLREPVQRAFSEFLYLRKMGMTMGDFREATREYPSIIRGSQYAAHLAMYLEHFPRHQLLIQRFENLTSDPSTFIRSVYSFIGVDPEFQPKRLRDQVLPAARARSPAIARAVKNTAIGLRNMGLGRAVGSLKQSKLLNRVLFTAYSQDNRPKLSQHDLMWLRTIFRPDVDALGALTGENFDDWLKIP